MNALIAKIFVNVNSKDELIKMISINDDIDIIKNPDYNEEKSKIFPDGFLYFPFLIELYSDKTLEEDNILNIKSILEKLWNNNYSAVVACDFEEKLPESGGFKSTNIPWKY